MSYPPRHVEVIYCDDIREEVGQKLSYMGVYFGELSVPSAPALLTKLCIAIKVVTTVDDPFEELEVRILMGDDERELISTGKISTPSDVPKVSDGARVLITQMTFVLAPFQIEGDTILRVKAVTEREELRGVALQIRINPALLPPTEPPAPVPQG